MDKFLDAGVAVAGLIVTVAILAVLVSRKAQTPQVIQAMGSAFGNSLGVAESPVTGETYHIDLSYPGGSGYSFGVGSLPYLGGFGS